MGETLTHCKNCGAQLNGEYCHACGQRADEPRRAVIGLVQDVFVDTLSIDGKLAKTIFLLLLQPGQLARLYLDGKRVSYSPPFRLYLFASVFFFLAAFSALKFEPLSSTEIELNEEAMQELEETDPAAAQKLRELSAAQAEDKPADDGAVDGAGANDSEGEGGASQRDGVFISLAESRWEDGNYNGPAWLEPYLKRMFEAGQRAIQDPRLFVSESRQNLPRIMLLAPVVYALVLLLLYWYRRKFYVYDHFVVSLYMHAALYAYLLFAILLSRFPVLGGLLWWPPLIWAWFQPFNVFRQAYGSRWYSALIKWAISISIYMIVLSVLITFGITYSLYQS